MAAKTFTFTVKETIADAVQSFAASVVSPTLVYTDSKVFDRAKADFDAKLKFVRIPMYDHGFIRTATVAAGETLTVAAEENSAAAIFYDGLYKALLADGVIEAVEEEEETEEEQPEVPGNTVTEG